ncbi:recombinase family protein [Saccharopolyspora phatthalungensis]|uniref:DNA invertase Pin-like site-specific DNA recombinase n=1 Tax=Saccharopolyspora phatthalungensis TaxID=664693 RepID=A0A840QID2_9PSEU|nr:recombinase family protein [Saccharopolyspora phatthalungensis]MBB5158345.1 DNA invertase Pin-like site-specific DNA recombinase [Saccharopolyspora phatthalungensis]
MGTAPTRHQRTHHRRKPIPASTSSSVKNVLTLDRVGRSTAHLVSLLDEFRQRDVAFRFLEQGIDTTTAEGRMVYRMLAAVAEFQRDLIVANTNEGLAAARARGRKGGRRPKLTEQQAELAQQLYDAREKTVQEIADLFTVPRSTIYGYLNKSDQPSGA